MITSQEIIPYIIKTLPIRNFWTGDVYLLFLPIICGIILGLLTLSVKKKYVLLFFLSLNFPPLILIENLKELYATTFFINYILVILFWTRFIFKPELLDFQVSTSPKSKILTINTLLILILILFTFVHFSLAFFSNESIVYGADTWYHISVSEKYFSEKSITGEGIIENSTNHYGPIYYIMNSITATVFSQNITTSINIIFFFFMFLVGLFFYLFTKKITNLETALVSSIFYMVMIYGSSEPVPNSLGRLLLIIICFFFILENKSSNFFLFLVYNTLIITHYEMAAYPILFFLSYYILKKLVNKKKIPSIIQKKIKSFSSRTKKEMLSANSFFIFLVFLGIFYLSFYFQIFNLENPNPTNWQLPSFVEEIPLNITYFFIIPLALLFPYAMYSYLLKSKKTEKQKLFLLSILILMSNSVFYYLNLFSFHHKYFSDFSFMIVVIPISTYWILSLLSSCEKKKKIFLLILSLILLCVIGNLKYERQNSYTSDINNYRDKLLREFNFTPSEEENKTTIVINPCDYLNRYIITSENYYIYSANYAQNKKCQRNIITNFNSKLEKYNFVNIDTRNELAYEFYETFSQESFENLEKYPFDYIVISKNEIAKNSQAIQFLIEKNNLEIVNENKYYEVLKK